MKLHGMTIVALFALAFGSATMHAHAHVRALQPAPTDNSAQNAWLLHLTSRRSLPAPALTADDQPNNPADRITAARVRRVIVKDDTLSIYAHNVKVIVTSGTVTLEGPVHSDDERQELAADAATVVSPISIINRITVA